MREQQKEVRRCRWDAEAPASIARANAFGVAPSSTVAPKLSIQTLPGYAEALSVSIVSINQHSTGSPAGTAAKTLSKNLITLFCIGSRSAHLQVTDTLLNEGLSAGDRHHWPRGTV